LSEIARTPQVLLRYHMQKWSSHVILGCYW